MSTILKALRRLEDERAAATQRTLHDEVVAPGDDGAGGRRPAWLFAAIGMGAGVALTVIIASYFASGASQGEGSPAPVLAGHSGAAVELAPPAAAASSPKPAVTVAVQERAPRRERTVAPRPVFVPPAVAAAPETILQEAARVAPPPVRESSNAARVAVVERAPAEPTFVPNQGEDRTRRVPLRGSVPPSAGIAAMSGLEPEAVVRSSPPAERSSMIPKKRYPSQPSPEQVAASEPVPSADDSGVSISDEMSGGIPGPTAAFLEAERGWDDGSEQEAIVATSDSDPWLAQPDQVAVAIPPPTAAPAMAAARRVAAPQVDVVRTVWHPQADRRTAEVRLDGSAETLLLREGDALGPLLLVAIEPSGIVLHQDGEEMRRRIGR